MVDTVRAGNSDETVTFCAASVTTPTSTGPFFGAFSCPQAVIRMHNAIGATRRLRSSVKMGMASHRYRRQAAPTIA
jgi:hypothetical protein